MCVGGVNQGMQGGGDGEGGWDCSGVVQGPPLTTCTALIVFGELKLSACG